MTPCYPPGMGGAATYFAILTNYLKNFKQINSIFILTECVKGKSIFQKKDKVRILRILLPLSRISLLPASRTGKIKWIFKGLIFILYQLQIFMTLFYLRLFGKLSVIHVHSYFLSIRKKYRNILLEKFMKAMNVKVILDIRDHLFIPKHDYFADKIICASENIFNQAVATKSVNRRKWIHVPIPFKRPDASAVSNIESVRIEKYKPYICFIGDIHGNKGIYELIEAFKSFRKNYKNYCLLFVGRNNEGNKFLNTVRKSENIIYLGPKSYLDALKIMKESELVVLPSKSEGMPRVCLEAISMGKKVLCPPNIPEFERSCPEWVIPKISSKVIISKIIEALNSSGSPKYQFEQHDPGLISAKVLALYQEVLQ